MSLTEKINATCEKHRAMVLRKRAAARTRAELLDIEVGSGSRLLRFIYSMERSNRLASNFALHVSRVERALETPVTSYVRFLQEVA